MLRWVNADNKAMMKSCNLAKNDVQRFVLATRCVVQRLVNTTSL